jgi:hypothetical protein
VKRVKFFLTFAAACAAGCGGSGGQGSYSFSPVAGNCSTSVMITGSTGISPQASVEFIGLNGNDANGVRESVPVSATQSDRQVLVTPPCDLPSGDYALTLEFPQGGRVVMGRFTKA